MGEAAPIITSLPSSDPMMSVTPELPSSFSRRIEFHLARKQFTGFTSNGGDKGGFQLETLNPSSGSGSANPNQGPEVQKGKSELVEKSGMDQELLSFRINLRKIGAGLQNLGNTCFLNSVLQCLTYTEPLAAYLQSGTHQTSCRKTGFCALCAIQKHVSRALNSTGRILAPKDLVSNLRCISRSFRNARQEDAHEYMVNLLESMHKCCLPSGVPSESPSAYERSLVHKIFGGRLRSQVKCQQCSYCSNKFDPFLDLSLEINKADSLHKALTHFTAKEQLDGGERQYQCQQCKQKVRALKQLTVHKPPHVLTIHLKRFGSHIQGHKIDKKIAFGPTLDLKPFVSGPCDGDLKYTLYGVLVHAGWSTHSGHYYSFVRTSTGMWYSLDDNQVVQVNERKVLEQKAYMLFYVRDQRNFVPKKVVDVAHKENRFLSAIANNAASNNKLGLGLKEAMENGSVDRKSNVTCSHAAAAQVNTSNTSASVEVPMKKAMPVSDNSMMADSPSLQKDAGISTSMLSEKVLVVPTLNGAQSPKQTALSVKACDSTLHNANDIRATVDLKNSTQNHINGSTSEVSNFNILQSASKEKSDSCTAPNNCNGVEDVKRSVIDTVDSVNTILAVSGEVSTREGTDPQKHENKEKSAIALPKTSGEIVNGEVLPQSRDGKSQEGSSSKLCNNGNSAGQSTLDVGHRPRKTTMKVSSKKIVVDKKPHLAVKRKLFKCPMARMHLCTNILFGSNLRVSKKKTKKRSRVCNLENKKVGQEHLSNGNLNDADLGPSSSENSKKISRGLSSCSHSKRKKGDNLVGKDVTESGDLQERIDEEFRERVVQNGSTLLSTDKQPQTDHSLASVADRSESREPTRDKSKDASQNGFMSILTRGLEEPIVPKWDEIQYPATGISTGPGEEDCVKIGYVADEWDEEYDRGKRKKVRMTKVEFGGPNPFQEIASKKAKRKRAKLESSSRNEPFRI